MSRESTETVALPPVQENIEELGKVIKDGNCDEAQQMYKSISERYISAQRFSEAMDLLHSGACLQLENSQVTWGSELSVMFVETLVKAKVLYDDDTLDRVRTIYKLFPQILVPQHLGEEDDVHQLAEALAAAKTRVECCASFLRAAISWSAEFGPHRSGSPQLHVMLAEYLYSQSPELDMANLTQHFVRGDDPEKFASILVSFMGKCYPGEDDLAIARAVLMYLSTGNMKDANFLLGEVKQQMEAKKLEFPQSDLIQFISSLLQTLQGDAYPLFSMLRASYKRSIDREPAFNEWLDDIGEVFYSVQQRNPLQGMFGDIFDVETDFLDADQVGQQEVEESGIDITDEKPSEWASLHFGSLANAHQASYQLSSDYEGEFHASDLVWGKVRSHPWWPGQIFDPSDASEQALKYQKKDSFLVAYFGDRTFAWNEAPLLKHFRSHFSQGEKQSNSESFQNAVGCALDELSRRVELGLACSCVPEEDAGRIKFQLLDNSGIQLEACKRGDFLGKSGSADLFEPVKLVNYVKSLAQCPAAGANQLDLVILKSQLFSFYRLKGYSRLPEFQFCGDLLEDADSSVHFSDEGSDDHAEISRAQGPFYYKRKRNLKDGVYLGKKEKWDSEEDEVGATDGKMVSPSSAKRRKGPNHLSDEPAPSEGAKTISLAKISNTTPTDVPKRSFKIGECIRRAASQMARSPSMLRSNSQKFDGSDVYDSPLLQQSDDSENNRVVSPMETHSSLDELLSQLQSAARDPLQRHGCLDVIVSFFSDFRNSVVVVDQHDKLGKKRKVYHSVDDSETFEFVDMNDTYWADRVIQNGSEEQPPPTTRKSRKRQNLFVPVSLDNKQTQRSNVRKKRYIPDGNDYNSASPEKNPTGYVDDKAPAELVMHFPVVDSVPSEMKLNKVFKCFGPLKESETEVDRDTNRARVVFKHCSDAQTAYGSASKFNIFGSLLVNYQLNYTISVPFKAVQLSMTHSEEDAALFLQY